MYLAARIEDDISHEDNLVAIRLPRGGHRGVRQ